MPDFTVARYGTDSSGRGIFATAFMWSVWQRVLAHPDVAPFAHKVVVTQGAFMVRNGGGADASAGYHDAAGTFDLRVWNLLSNEVDTLLRVLRSFGCAAWLRNEAHGGFADDHIHFVLGSDRPLSDGAAYQWRDYIAGGDGMGGRDYHPRPTPLITEPPEDDMPFTEKQLEDIVRRVVHEEIANAGETILIANPLDDGKKPKWKLAAILGRTFKAASD